MKKEIAIQLKDKIIELINNFNNPNREYYTGEEFKFIEVIPLSELSACIILEKNTGKRAFVHGIYIKNWWTLYFPTESHIYGFDKIKDIHRDIEKYNFKFNLDGVIENDFN